MPDFALAHALHVLAIIIWIGGVGFVTLVILPGLDAIPPEERMAAFARIEGRFSKQARLWVLLAGLSGLWMCWRANLWPRFTDGHFWWMHAMVVVWALFAVILFVAEPLVLHRRMRDSRNPARDHARMKAMHRVLLGLGLIAAFGAAAGSHGWY